VKTRISTTGKSNKPAALRLYHPKSMSTNTGDAPGFTLMELIIVCSLVGLLLTIAIPSLKNTLITNQLDSTARKLIGTVKELRNRAVREHKAYLLHFEISENGIWYEEDNTLNVFGNSPTNMTRLPEEVRMAGVQMRQAGEVANDKATLWISKKGYMDELAVYLRDEDGREKTLFFSPFSGSARLYDEYVEMQ